MSVKTFNSVLGKLFALAEGVDSTNYKISSVRITDGEQVWKTTDIVISMSQEAKWNSLRSLLTEQECEQIPNFQRSQEHLTLEWTWKENEEEGMEITEKIQLQACPAKHEMVRILSILTDSLQVVKDIQTRVDTDMVRYQEMSKHLEEIEQEKQELLERFAVVLNEKKRQVRFFAEKAGMISDKGIYQLQDHEKEEIPDVNTVTNDIQERESVHDEENEETERAASPVRELEDLDDIMNADTQPLPDELNPDQQQLQSVEESLQAEPQQDEKKEWQQNQDDERIVLESKVIKKGGSKRGRARGRGRR
eukprot:TRINITY_DN10299_c0_g1_i10.p2 TRINITY_DN10299_c0_g1~~TRINITY_DN10299_c0_g1_i10.p2  ORF type:complete len:320 (-),score=54.57 TRINITY_DN10299_c0_g1_i10:1060-1980(-)